MAAMKEAKTYAKYAVIIVAVIAVASTSAIVLFLPQIATHTTASPTTQTVTSMTTRSTTTLSGVINGAGATFPNPQIQAWASKFYQLTGGRIQVNYQSIGSGAGQAKFREGVLDFAGSDPPLKSEIYNEFKDKGGIIQFPIIIGTIVVVHNIPGVESGKLRLTGEVVAKIYLGEITYWDDPAIKMLNPELSLPHEKIIAVHRSDGSGTTRVFTAYLSKVSEAWKSKVGSDFTVAWPVDELGNGVGGKGNEGVSAAVKQNPYSIGYVETAYVYSTGLAMALLRNRDGNYVLPTREAVASAVKALAKVLPRADEDWSHIFPDETVDPPGGESYPLTSFSFVILRQVYDDPVKAAILREFFEWVLTEGQKPENIVEGYEPLPQEVATIGLDGLKLLRTK
jgi:phosphate transport system substrate-binding protein